MIKKMHAVDYPAKKYNEKECPQNLKHAGEVIFFIKEKLPHQKLVKGGKTLFQQS
jgi:hypothetical protein